MQNRIVKSCQPRKNRRTERLRELLQLKQSDAILLDACARKSPQDVYELIQALPDLNPDSIRDRFLRTPLHIACSRRDHENATRIASLLIRAGSDVMNEVGDVDGLLPMHMAVLAGNDQCVLMLLSKGANIPASNPFRLTSLLLVKFKLDNLRQTQYMINSSNNNSSSNNNNHNINNNNTSNTMEMVMEDKSIEEDIEEDDDLDKVVYADDYLDWLISDSAKSEYEDLKSIVKVLVTHLASTYIKVFGLPSTHEEMYGGVSDYLFDPISSIDYTTRRNSIELTEAISSLTNHLAAMEMNDNQHVIIQESMNDLIEKVKQLGVNEVVN